jgi:four helix bundle protein
VFRLYPKVTRAGVAHAYVARQLLRAATSIGANLEEGHACTTRREMGFKHRLSLREAREANYWARLLATDPAWAKLLAETVRETAEFVAMLTTSVKRLSLPRPASLALRVPCSFRRSGLTTPVRKRRRTRRG